MTRPVIVLLVVAVAGCGSTERSNATCQWPSADTPRTLDLQSASDRRHLQRDALLAEDMAIRHADVIVRRGTVYFRGGQANRVAREHCMVSLLAVVGELHGVAPGHVREFTDQRSMLFDGLILTGFAILLVVASTRLARLVTRSSLGASRLATVALLIVMSSVGALGFLVGDLWSVIAESVRLGTDHVSYRADRVLWRQYPQAAFVGCLVLCWIVGLTRCWVHRFDWQGDGAE